MAVYICPQTKIRSTLETISFINNIIANNRVDKIIIQGDLNTQLDSPNSKCSKIFRDFIKSHNIVNTFRESYPDISNQKGTTYPKKGNSNPRRIDYIFMSKSLYMKTRPTFKIIPNTLVNSDHNQNMTNKEPIYTYPFNDHLLSQDFFQYK